MKCKRVSHRSTVTIFNKRSTCFSRVHYLVCAAVLGWAASASAQLKVYLDPDRDGVYQKVGSYSVSFDDAIRAFADAGGAPATGDSTLGLQRLPSGVSFDGPQSWDGFIDFLDANFGADAARTGQLCDDTVALAGPITWTCGGGTCPPGTCTPDEYDPGSASAAFTCVNDPPCPGEKPRCVPIAATINISAFDFAGGDICECDGGDPNLCVVGPGTATGTGVIFDNDVCQCFEPVPAASEWGLIVMAVLVLTAGTVLVGRRRRPATV